MSIKIEINAKQLNASEPLQLHYLPCKIDGDGEANVDSYFNNYTEKHAHAGGILTNSLRGFPLLGEQISVPEGYRALVLQETKALSETERTLRLTGTFERFHYWNYDKVPSKEDSYRQALQTLTIAKELAKPISEADVEKEIATKAAAKENQ